MTFMWIICIPFLHVGQDLDNGAHRGNLATSLWRSDSSQTSDIVAAFGTCQLTTASVGAMATLLAFEAIPRIQIVQLRTAANTIQATVTVSGM